MNIRSQKGFTVKELSIAISVAFTGLVSFAYLLTL